MNENIPISTPMLGMNTDKDPSAVKPEELTYALNAKSHNPFYSNYEGNELHYDFISQQKPGCNILHFLHLTKGDICLFLVNPTDKDSEGRCYSEIGILDGQGRYTTKVKDYGLNFSINHQIQAQYKPNVLGERVIYWCDGPQNSIRYLNIDNLPATFSADNINLFRNYSIPEITVSAISSNGVLQSGSYQFTVQYADANGNGVTPFVPSTNPVPLYKDNTTDNYKYINGDEAGVLTGKSVELTLTSLDTSFEYYNLTVIKTIKGVQIAEVVATLPTTQTKFVYTGADTTTRNVSLSEITLKRVTYKGAGTVTQSNGHLLWGNLIGNEEYNLQPYFNKLQIKWKTYPIKAYDVQNNYKNPLSTTLRKGYMRDEVYPFAIQIDWTDGTTSPAYHIPGRKKNYDSKGQLITRTTDQYGKSATSGKWDEINNSGTQDDVVDTKEKEKWQVYNTAYVTENTPTAQGGEMSYWESDLYTYPNKPEIWGDLAGQPIRHHKFPDSSICHIHDGLNNTGTTLDTEPVLNLLGIELPNIKAVLASLPDEVKAKIQGWRIVRGDRTYHKSVIAKGLISNLWEKNFAAGNVAGIPDNRYYQNYPLNDLRADPFIAQSESNRFGRRKDDDSWFPPTSGNHHTYHKSKFSFFSPDTTFEKAFLSVNHLKVETEEIGGTELWYHLNGEMGKFIETPKAGDEVRHVFCQQNALGLYAGYKVPAPGNIRRKINEAMYVPHNQQVQAGVSGKIIHNNHRESTVFVDIDKDLTNPTVQDETRWGLSEKKKDDTPTDIILAGRSRNLKTKTSAYYATLKSGISGQYGSIFDITYIDTGYHDKSTDKVIFGGDTFISQFSIKRQLPFFGDTLNQFIDRAEVKDNLDLRPVRVIPDTKFFYWWGGGQGDEGYYGYGHESYTSNYMGYIPCVVSGIATFWTESEINTELRNEGSGELETYYPNMKAGTVKDEAFLGLKSSASDNFYSYNKDYSLTNRLYLFEGLSPNYNPNQDSIRDYFNRVIYSPKSQSETYYDSWLTYKANDYYDFPKSKGKLVDMRYIGQNRILFRFEEALYLQSLYGSLGTSEGEILLGSGKLFERDPMELAYSEVGSIGTRSQWAFNSNKSGQFMVDDIRGVIYHYGEGLTDISSHEMKDWFSEHLPLQLIQDFPGVSADNPYNPSGTGFISTYDPKNDLWLLTKRDYSVIDKSLITSGKLVYTNNQFKLNGRIVDVTTTSVFANKSWTIGYSIANKRWISFYSFIPNYYIHDKLGYYSGINALSGTSVWCHLKGDYASYYGKQYPHILEAVLRSEGINSTKTSAITFQSKALLRTQEDVYEQKNITFDQGVIYNDEQCSGLLNLKVQDESDLSSLFNLPNTQSDIRQISLRKRDNVFNFSEFFDLVKDRREEIPFFTGSPLNPEYLSKFPVDKVLNIQALDYEKAWHELKNFKGNYVKLRLISEGNNKYNLITKFIIEKPRVSIR